MFSLKLLCLILAMSSAHGQDGNLGAALCTESGWAFAADAWCLKLVAGTGSKSAICASAGAVPAGGLSNSFNLTAAAATVCGDPVSASAACCMRSAQRTITWRVSDARSFILEVYSPHGGGWSSSNRMVHFRVSMPINDLTFSTLRLTPPQYSGWWWERKDGYFKPLWDQLNPLSRPANITLVFNASGITVYSDGRWFLFDAYRWAWDGFSLRDIEPVASGQTIIFDSAAAAMPCVMDAPVYNPFRRGSIVWCSPLRNLADANASAIAGGGRLVTLEEEPFAFPVDLSEVRLRWLALVMLRSATSALLGYHSSCGMPCFSSFASLLAAGAVAA